MSIVKHDEVRFEDVTMEGVSGVVKADVIGQAQGWESHRLRVFKLEPQGYTPRHKHPWEHVNYVISGRGRLHLAGEDGDIVAGDFICVPPDTEHQFQNPYDEPLQFICIVPNAATS